MIDWISVEDKWPCERCQVLTHGENGYTIRIYYLGNWYDEHGRATMNVMGDIEDITHWMLLPEPPEAES